MLIYKVILKPVWTYGIQLWGSASNSNIDILQTYQSKTLRTIAQVPWYVSNDVIHNDLQISTVKEEIKSFSTKYHLRLECHPNVLATNLLDITEQTRRLRRFKPSDLLNRF